MELSEIDEETIIYFSSLTLNDMFPNSIFYPTQIDLPEITSDFKKSKKMIDYKLDINGNLNFGNDTKIYNMKTMHNILGVCGGSYLKIYNIETFDLVLFFQVPKGNLFALAFNGNTKLSEINCVIGGEEPVIRVISVMNANEIHQLIGHRSDIYDLKFSPKEEGILLSSSKDCTIRLWNINNCNQICIFGGPSSHLSDVLSIDWHMTGELIVSSGIDNSVKIYAINKTIQALINKSLRSLPIKTILKNKPLYSCNEIHHDYVDCVRFHGNFIISKSVDGVIKEWLPTFNKEGNYFFLINTYTYSCHEKIFNVKFELDMEKKLLFIGNEVGQIFMAHIVDCENMLIDQYHFTSQATLKLETNSENLIRCIAYSDAYNCIFVGTEKNNVLKINITKGNQLTKDVQQDNTNKANE